MMNVVITPATIAKLELGQDDVVVVRSTVNMTPEFVGQIHEQVKEAVGDHKILILSPNLSIEVIAK